VASVIYVNKLLLPSVSFAVSFVDTV